MDKLFEGDKDSDDDDSEGGEGEGHNSDHLHNTGGRYADSDDDDSSSRGIESSTNSKSTDHADTNYNINNNTNNSIIAKSNSNGGLLRESTGSTTSDHSHSKGHNSDLTPILTSPTQKGHNYDLPNKEYLTPIKEEIINTPSHSSHVFTSASKMSSSLASNAKKAFSALTPTIHVSTPSIHVPVFSTSTLRKSGSGPLSPGPVPGSDVTPATASTTDLTSNSSSTNDQPVPPLSNTTNNRAPSPVPAAYTTSTSLSQPASPTKPSAASRLSHYTSSLVNSKHRQKEQPLHNSKRLIVSSLLKIPDDLNRLHYDRTSMYGLYERVVAGESCWFAAKVQCTIVYVHIPLTVLHVHLSMLTYIYLVIRVYNSAHILIYTYTPILNIYFLIPLYAYIIYSYPYIYI